LILVSIGSLALGHYFAYRQGAWGRQRVMLWIATPASLALWVVQWLFR